MRKTTDYKILLPNALIGAILLGGIVGWGTYTVYPFFYPESKQQQVESRRVMGRRDRGGSEYNISRARGSDSPMDPQGAGVLGGFGGSVVGWLIGSQRARQIMQERDRRRQMRGAVR